MGAGITRLIESRGRRPCSIQCTEINNTINYNIRALLSGAAAGGKRTQKLKTEIDYRCKKKETTESEESGGRFFFFSPVSFFFSPPSTGVNVGTSSFSEPVNAGGGVLKNNYSTLMGIILIFIWL